MIMLVGLYYILHELRTNFCQMKLQKYLSELARIPISPSEMRTYVIWQECCFVSAKPWGSKRRLVSNIITWAGSAVTQWKFVHCARATQFKTAETVSLILFVGRKLLTSIYYDFASTIWNCLVVDILVELICGNKMPTRCNRWFAGCWPTNRTHNPQLHTIPTTWKPKHQIPQTAISCIILSSSWWWA